jgi:hypothetical protein
MELPRDVQALARQQVGVVTRRQLLDHGVEAAAIRWRLGRSWRLLLPGVVLLEPGRATREQCLAAALHYAGPGSWLAGPTAAVLHGLVEPHTQRRVHVLVPAPRNPRDVAWLSVRRTHLLDERLTQRGPLVWSCASRAVVDAAAAAPTPRDATSLVIRAVQDRRVRLEDVHHWVEARRPNGRAVLRAAVEQAAAGAWSVPEAELLRLVSASRALPEVWPNPELRDGEGRRLTTPDAWFDDVALAVMVHSRRFHADELAWDATVDADSDLVAAGVRVVGVTPRAIARDPARVMHRIESAHASARAAGGRAAVVATPRPNGLRPGA